MRNAQTRPLAIQASAACAPEHVWQGHGSPTSRHTARFRHSVRLNTWPNDMRGGITHDASKPGSLPSAPALLPVLVSPAVLGLIPGLIFEFSGPGHKEEGHYNCDPQHDEQPNQILSLEHAPVRLRRQPGLR